MQKLNPLTQHSLNLITLNSSSQAKYHALRLTPGQDLKLELISFCQKNNIKAAALVSAVGSLKQTHLRLANSNQFLKIKNTFEIVSVTGTLSDDGCHLHVSIADSEGRVLGGHLMNENLIYTTCEIVLVEMTEYEFKRELDSETTFKELKIYFKKS
jgi:predicted DNA-binding protein with PD1-like motif